MMRMKVMKAVRPHQLGFMRRPELETRSLFQAWEHPSGAITFHRVVGAEEPVMFVEIKPKKGSAK